MGFWPRPIQFWCTLWLPCGEGNGNALQYSCLDNSVDKRAWWATVHGITQSWTQLKQLSTHACTGEGNGSPLQCSCLENPRDGGARWAAVCGVAQSRTGLKWLSSSSSMIPLGVAIGGNDPYPNHTVFHLLPPPLQFTRLNLVCACCVLGHSTVSDSLRPHGL